MSDDPTPEAVAAAATPPVGVSSNQIFAVAMILLAMYAIYGVAVMVKGDASERTAFGQSTINLALVASGFYLGSSASSRNKDNRP